MKTQPLVIRLTDEASSLLKSLRKPGESWSDVVARCAATEKEAQESEKPMCGKKVDSK